MLGAHGDGEALLGDRATGAERGSGLEAVR